MIRTLVLNVEMDVSVPKQGRVRRVATYWYSPEARHTVKFTTRVPSPGSNTDIELLAYKLVE